MSNEKIPVIWNQTIIGYVQDMKFDMFDWYGNWLPETHQVAEEFMDELKKVDELKVEIGLSRNPTIGYVSTDSFYDDEINIKVR